MKLNRIWGQARTLAISAMLFVATNAYAGALVVRDESGGEGIFPRIMRFFVRLIGSCGDTLTNPGG